MEDVRYSEMVFLRELAASNPKFELFGSAWTEQLQAVGLDQNMYVDMAAELLENYYVRFDDQHLQILVSRLRGEYFSIASPSRAIYQHQWADPRSAIRDILRGQALQRLRITYRGLRRIAELRDVLQRDRILEPFGILLSIQYFRKDLEEALRRGADVPVSVIYIDMDDFKPINEKFGMAGGDVVMQGYLTAVRDKLGVLGTGYRGVGDEVVGLVIGQIHARVLEIAESILERVRSMGWEYGGKKLPKVTASVGLVTTPPAARGVDIETIAEERKRRAKAKGKNCVVAT